MRVRIRIFLFRRLSKRRGYTSSRPRKRERNSAILASGEERESTGSINVALIAVITALPADMRCKTSPAKRAAFNCDKFPCAADI